MSVRTISLDQRIEDSRREVGALESIRVVPKRYSWLSRAEILKKSSASLGQGRQELPWVKSNTASASYQPTYLCEVES
jgi:hypothetical protein